ncbi:hypothetical protein [Armatimonas sp.]|uniref:hypothetical protein n=1 Tax=Armatimonas sp. TaxID=1872638 RepID=UPI00286D393B|nr:hypothetical protein [Armatimonas sp.]
MKKSMDQRFEMEDDKGRKADCRVRVFLPQAEEEMNDAVVLLGWSPAIPDFATGPWMETILSGFREGLADVQSDLEFLLIEWYEARCYKLSSVIVDFEEEIGLVLFKDLMPSCNSAAANLRAGKRKPKAADNAPVVRKRRSVYWLPLCREAVEDVVGESLDAPVLESDEPSDFDPVYSIKERLVTA